MTDHPKCCTGRGPAATAAAGRRPARARAIVLLVGLLGMPAAMGQPAPGAPDMLDILKRVVVGPAPAGAQPGSARPNGAEPARPDEAAGTWAGEPAAAPAEQQVIVRDSGLLDLHVRDLDIGTVLEMLSYEAKANIVASTSVTGRVSANLYAVSLEDALTAILTPSKFTFAMRGGTVFVGRDEDLATLFPPPATRVFTLRYIRPAEAAAALKAVLGPEANIVEGGGDAAVGARSATGATMSSAGVDYLVVTARPDRLTAAEELLTQIDQRPKQVLIEATVLRATLNEQNAFGIDFTMLGGVDFQNVGGQSAASADLRLGALPAADLQSTTFNVNTEFAGNVTGGGFTFGLIKDSIAGFIRALEEITDVVVVANPKIVALNKQEAEVIVGRRDGYLTTTVTETAAVQTVEFLETGTQIKFRPLINDDGSVRLAVHPKDSNGGLSAANLPFEETTEAHADILVKDGHTVLIGGLFRERTVNTRSQIPVLGNIPVLGLAFGSRNDQTVREEVIILLTVHIIKESPAEHEYTAQLVDDIERVRVGLRQGLLGTGRERLAQAYYREALRQLENNNTERALLNARMAVHNQPRHLSALKLKERLLGERLWDDEGSRMRTTIWELIDLQRSPDQPPPPPLFGRPGHEPDPGDAS